MTLESFEIYYNEIYYSLDLLCHPLLNFYGFLLIFSLTFQINVFWCEIYVLKILNIL